MKVLKKRVMRAWPKLCALLAGSWLLWGTPAQALPPLGCQTVSIRDPDGVVAQLGKSDLMLALKTLSLTYVAEPTAADVLLEFEFFSASGRIVGKVRTWTESAPQLVESERIRWHEDFAARRRVIEPMGKSESEQYRAQIVGALRTKLDSHVSAVALGSEPEGLPVALERPAGVKVPFERDRTVALLGCLSEGEEVAGYVSWPDGHREPFLERASQNPGRRVLRRAVAEPQPSAAPEGERDPDDLVRIEQALGTPRAKKPPSAGARVWVFGGAVITLIAFAAALVAYRRRNSRK